MKRQTSRSPQCRELMTRLSEYIDGELEESLCEEIDRHLAVCEDCRVLVDTFRKTVELYRHYSREVVVDLPPETRNRLWQALSDAGCVSK